MTEIIEVEVEGGIYKIMKPGGRLGVIMMGLMTKTALEMQRNTGQLTDPDLNEDPEVLKRLRQIDEIKDTESELNALMSTFAEFSEQVLPHIIMDGSPNTYEECPGEDQFGIYLALMRASKSKADPFRILTPKYAEKLGDIGNQVAHPTINPGGVDKPR